MKSLKRQFNSASLSLEITRNEVRKNQAVKTKQIKHTQHKKQHTTDIHVDKLWNTQLQAHKHVEKKKNGEHSTTNARRWRKQEKKRKKAVGSQGKRKDVSIADTCMVERGPPCMTSCAHYFIWKWKYNICFNFISIIDFSLAGRVLLGQHAVTKATGARI